MRSMPPWCSLVRGISGTKLVRRGIIAIVSEHFCYSCGAPTAALGQQLVAVCANCRARGQGEAGAVAQWMVRSGGGSARGPMAKAAVLNGLGRGRFRADDLIGGVGGEEMPLADHPDFRGCFIPGSADEIEIDRIRREFDGIARRGRQRRLLNALAGVALLGVSGTALWVASTSRMLLMPDAWIVVIEDRIDWWQKRGLKPVRTVAVPRVDSLSHGDWVKAQRPDPTGTALHRARSDHWVAPSNQLDRVRRTYLQAISQNPLDPMPLAGLVTVDAEMLYTRPELLGEVSRAMSRLGGLNASGPAVSSATAALSLAQGNRSRAKGETEACAKSDAMCAILHGEATLNTAEVAGVIARLGPTPFALRRLCRTALAAGDWSALQDASVQLIELLPDDPSGHGFLAEFYAGLGQIVEAGNAAERAVHLGSERAEMQHLYAVSLMATSLSDPRLDAAFDALIVHPHLSAQTRRQTVLIQAAQVQIARGDLGSARMIVDSALEVQSASQAAAVLLANILVKEGRHGEAESVLRDLDATALEPQDAALVHLWTARMYLDMGKQRLARQEIENSLRLDPNSPAAHEETVWAAVQAKDVNGALDALEKLVVLEPFRARDVDLREGQGLWAPKRRALVAPLLRAIDADVRYEPQRETVAALMSWLAKRPGHLDHLQDALEADPSRLSLQTALAIAGFEAGQWSLAETNAQAVVARKPSLAIMHSIRGRSLAALGRWPEAVDPLKRSVRGEAAQPDLLRMAAVAWRDNGDPGAARALLDQAQAIAPWDSRIRRALFALEGLGK
jgi:tetratricopeptide (TPR) repeat protein